MGGIIFTLITRFKLGQNVLRLDQPKDNFLLGSLSTVVVFMLVAHVRAVLVEQLNARRNACFLIVLELQLSHKSCSNGFLGTASHLTWGEFI